MCSFDVLLVLFIENKTFLSRKSKKEPKLMESYFYESVKRWKICKIGVRKTFFLAYWFCFDDKHLKN